MFEEKTFANILSEMQAKIPDGVDAFEGSIIYDALAPAALEFARIYWALNNVIDETFADTAGRESLIKRAAERGLSPYLATASIVKGRFDAEIPIGSRFAFGDLRFKVVEDLGNGDYKLICETLGTIGNRTGEIIPVDYIYSLTSSMIVEILIPGTDEEETERFRKRYFDSLAVQRFGGNIADYREKVLSIAGTGGLKVYPAWQGGGTVRLAVQGSDFGVPTQLIISEVKRIIDPENASGDGEGFAPIGHFVTVNAVEGVVIDVSARFTFEAGWSFADCAPYLSEAISAYFNELSANWDKSEFLTVRISQVEARALSAAGIADVFDLRLNGSNQNLNLGRDQIPLRGVISHVN